MSDFCSRPLRVLHCLWMWEYGGIESWLLDLMRLRRPEIQFESVVLCKGRLEDEAVSLGMKVHRIPIHNPAYFRPPKELDAILQRGNYDAVHFHLMDFAGHVLQRAARYGIPVRVAHAHNTARDRCKPILNTAKTCYHQLFNKPLLATYATNLLACSQDAGRYLFGSLWNRLGPAPEGMVYCGTSLRNYDVDPDPVKRLELCRRYGIPENAIVIGHLGRMTYQKNQTFLIRLLAKLLETDNRYVLFIGGDGEERRKLDEEAAKRCVENRVFMPGPCDNVPELICRLFDVFCLPSHFEGFGIVLVEAAAGGLYNVCSQVVSQDIRTYIPDCVMTLDLDSDLSVWCEAVAQAVRIRRSPREGVRRIRETPFTIEHSLDALLRIYRQARSSNFLSAGQ